MRMNPALGKSILALVRDGDYAHAGEEAYEHTHRVYRALLEAIREKGLGGVVIYSRAV